jgi:hypothetical protein
MDREMKKILREAEKKRIRRKPIYVWFLYGPGKTDSGVVEVHKASYYYLENKSGYTVSKFPRDKYELFDKKKISKKSAIRWNHSEWEVDRNRIWSFTNNDSKAIEKFLSDKRFLQAESPYEYELYQLYIDKLENVQSYLNTGGKINSVI